VLAPQRRSSAEKLRRYALSAAASVAAAAFVWMAMPDDRQDSLQVAAVPAPKLKPVNQVAVPAGDGAKDYLLAHQRYSPSNAMQGVAPYVRTVASERSASHR
jgi:hypothetical protein